MAVLFLGLIMIIALIKDSISAISRKIKIGKIDTSSNNKEIDNINTIKIESKLIETEKNEFIEKINKIYTKYIQNTHGTIIKELLL